MAFADRNLLGIPTATTPGSGSTRQVYGALLSAVEWENSSISLLGYMLNNYYGDCVVAAAGHLIQVWNQANKNAWYPSTADIMGIYKGTPNFKIGPDQGRMPTDVLDYINENGIGPGNLHRLFYTEFNPASVAQLKEVVDKLGGAFVVIGLPQSVAYQPPVYRIVSGAKGEVASYGWHSIAVTGYDEHFVYIISWGKLIPCTWKFFTKYIGVRGVGFGQTGYACLGWDWCPTVQGARPVPPDYTGLHLESDGTYTINVSSDVYFQVYAPNADVSSGSSGPVESFTGVTVPWTANILSWLSPFVGRGLSNAQAQQAIQWWSQHFDSMANTNKSPNGDDFNKLAGHFNIS